MDQLIQCRCIRSNAKFNLFCFPWMGGGSLFYANWFKLLPDSIEVNAIRLPGRESRYKDPLYKDFQELMNDVSEILLPKFKEKPFIFFGHSFGATLAYGLATHLKQQYNIEPHHVIVSGTSCPQSPKRKEGNVDWKSITEDEFIDVLRKMGGTPPEVLGNRDLMKLSMRATKADAQILEGSEDQVPLHAVLSCPISFFDGDKDKEHDYKGWGDLTSGPFYSQILPGGHFYLHQDINYRKITGYILQQLKVLTPMTIFEDMVSTMGDDAK